MKQKHLIDAHKAATGLFVLVLMTIFEAWGNTAAWIYLAIHGAYGILWVWKSRVFPDKQWEKSTGPAFAFVILGGLTLYWIAPWLLISRAVIVPNWVIGLCLLLFATGIFLHFVSDMQKHIWMATKPETLLRTGLWARCRNPNYLGELLIYLSFAILPMHWLPPLILIAFVGAYWIPKMKQKDRSLSRYPEFADWKRKSWAFIPEVW